MQGSPAARRHSYLNGVHFEVAAAAVGSEAPLGAASFTRYGQSWLGTADAGSPNRIPRCPRQRADQPAAEPAGAVFDVPGHESNSTSET